MAETQRIPFGPADIIVGTGNDAVRFDGKIGVEGSQAQSEGGSINIESTFADITSVDFGESPIDKFGTGTTVTVTISALYEEIDTLKLAIGNAVEISNGSDGSVTGVADAPIGQSSAERGVPVRIHPRNVPHGKYDYTIYNMASTESFERSFGLEQSSIEINFEAFPRKGADASKAGNFFYTGEVDPNGLNLDFGMSYENDGGEGSEV